MEEFLSWSIVTELVSTGEHQAIQGVFEAFTWWNDAWFALGGVFCFFRLLALIWVIKDANARSDNRGFQFLAAIFVLVLTPVFWLPLYIACRPQGRKRDKTPRRQASLTKLQECENCKSLVPREHDCCINCGDALKVECRECSEFYAHEYAYCPRCGAPHLEK